MSRVFNSRGKEHGGRANQLQFASQHRHLREEAVNVVDGQTQRLPVQLVLLRHLNQPVSQNAAHAARDVRLFTHVANACSIPQLQHNIGILKIQDGVSFDIKKIIMAPPPCIFAVSNIKEETYQIYLLWHTITLARGSTRCQINRYFLYSQKAFRCSSTFLVLCIIVLWWIWASWWPHQPFGIHSQLFRRNKSFYLYLRSMHTSASLK